MPRGGRRPGAGRKRRDALGQNIGCVHEGEPIRGARPTHGLYSRYLPADWSEPYEYFKSDADYTSMRSEIALAQTNMARFLKRREGRQWREIETGYLCRHLEHIGNLKEREGRLTVARRAVDEMLTEQVGTEIRALHRILTHHVDSDTADRICRELAAALDDEAPGRARAGLNVTV